MTQQLPPATSSLEEIRQQRAGRSKTEAPGLPFGIEEEYLLLDARTGKPRNCAANLVRAAGHLQKHTEREFLSSQIETATPKCESASQAQSYLEKYRAVLAAKADSLGVVLAGTGLPPSGGDIDSSVTPRARYRALYAATRNVAAHHYATGCHVHVEVPSRDLGVAVLGWLSRWAPLLAALSANSPLWMDRLTGFASWRHISGLQWPGTGYPPAVRNGAEYHEVVGNLISTGVLLDTGMVSWVARLSARFPTVEIRLADSQLTAADAVDFALLLRALVDRALSDTLAGEPITSGQPTLVDGAIWAAARDGMSAEIIDPVTAQRRNPTSLVEQLFDLVEPQLSRSGDRGRVGEYLMRRLDAGSPAKLQEQAYASGGISGVLDLFRESMTNGPRTIPHPKAS